MNKKNSPERKKKKNGLRQKMAEMLELPTEVVADKPKVVTVGKNEVYIENYKGIIEFVKTLVKVNTSNGIITITGNDLSIKEITSEDIVIKGDIENIDYDV